MAIIKFSIDLAASPVQLLQVAKDYEKYPFFLPDQLKKVEIIEKNEDHVITEDTFVFNTIFKKEIKQKSKHQILDNQLSMVILSGPIKDSLVNAFFEKTDSGSHISVNIDLKLGLKFKIFLPIIKKLHSLVLTGIFYKMNTKALEIEMS